MHQSRMTLLLASALGALLLATSASAATPGYRVLHAFGVNTAPRDPGGEMVADAAGVLYGVAAEGGNHMNGAVYSLDPASGEVAVMHAFGAAGDTAGEMPFGTLARDSAGNLYGTTHYGALGGDGAVFKIDAQSHALTVLAAFGSETGARGSGGWYPNASSSLVMDAHGNLFGTTEHGGGCGTVFEVSPNGALTRVYAFRGTKTIANGCEPDGPLALDGEGHLYGATKYGGAESLGTVYQLTLGNGSTPATLTVLHSFAGGTDGAVPSGGVVLDAAHKQLYGTTFEGGADDSGTVFACAVDGSGARVVYAFQGTGSGDGALPTGPLAIDSAGMLYGTTRAGGVDDMGTVYSVDPSSGAESVLHRFAGPATGDGEYPTEGVMLDAAGELVGTTRIGGKYDTGTVFALPR